MNSEHINCPAYKYPTHKAFKHKPLFVTKLIMQFILYFVAVIATAAHATEGNYEVGNNVVNLTEDHYGTLLVSNSSLTTIDCQGHRIINDDQPAACFTDSGNAFQCGIHITNSIRTEVRNCTIENFDVGINILSAAIVSIDDNTLLDNTEGLRTVYFGNVWLNGNSFQRGFQGVSVRNGSNFEFIGNDVWWVDGDGMDVNFSSSVYIGNNTFHENTDHNVEIDDSSNITVDNNYFDGRRFRDGVDLETTSDNLQIENASNISVTNNYIRDAGRNGIYIRNVSNGSVRFNDVNDSSRITSDSADCRHRDSNNITYYGNNFRTVYSPGTCGQ